MILLVASMMAKTKIGCEDLLKFVLTKKSRREILRFIQIGEASLKTMNLAQKLQNSIQMEKKICEVWFYSL